MENFKVQWLNYNIQKLTKTKEEWLRNARDQPDEIRRQWIKSARKKTQDALKIKLVTKIQEAQSLGRTIAHLAMPYLANVDSTEFWCCDRNLHRFAIPHHNFDQMWQFPYLIQLSYGNHIDINFDIILASINIEHTSVARHFSYHAIYNNLAIKGVQIIILLGEFKRQDMRNQKIIWRFNIGFWVKKRKILLDIDQDLLKTFKISWFFLYQFIY